MMCNDSFRKSRYAHSQVGYQVAAMKLEERSATGTAC